MRFCGVTRRRLRMNAATCSLYRDVRRAGVICSLCCRRLLSAAAAALTTELSQERLRAANRCHEPAIIGHARAGK